MPWARSLCSVDRPSQAAWVFGLEVWSWPWATPPSPILNLRLGDWKLQEGGEGPGEAIWTGQGGYRTFCLLLPLAV